MREQNANRVTTTPEKYTLNRSEETFQKVVIFLFRELLLFFSLISY